MDPVNVPAKFELRIALPVPESFGWGLQILNLLQEEAAGGRGWYRTKERW